MNIKSQIINILADQLGIEKEKIKNDSKLADDLGADSLDTVELTQVLEENFNITIPNEDVIKIKTVDDLIAYINSNIKK